MIDSNNLVECPYCKKKMKQITELHLKFKHQKTKKEMLNEFPDIKITSDYVKEEIKKTFIKKYGVDNPSKSKEVKEKIKDTCIRKYGVSCSLHNLDIQKKVKETNLERYGTENYFSSEDSKLKINKTNLEKYGCHPRKLDSTKEKIKMTCIEKYGEDNPFKVKEIKDKIRNNNLEKYGVENPSQNEEIKRKRKETFISKYGVGYFPEARLYAQIKYNIGNISELDFVKEKKKKKILEKHVPKMFKILESLKVELIDEKYIDAHYKHNWKCLVCGTNFNVCWNQISNGYKCPVCFPSLCGTSNSEIELKQFILGLGVEIIENDRLIIKPKELDIVIPGKKIAIEYCGLYYHSNEMINNKYYHLEKLDKCQKNGYSLVTIFEDEWFYNKDIVKSRLIYILGKSDSEIIHARKCQIKEINSNEKNDFLKKFHIQGEDRSTIKLGAFYNNELVSVMTFSYGNIAKGSKKQDKVWELSRFCSDYNYKIPGIASKLLTYFKKNYDWEVIFSYADRRWSNGNLYEKLGFTFSHFSKPNYWYIKGINRIHRFNLRKKPNEPTYLTEVELRRIEGYNRIFDCGNIKYVLKRN